MNMNRLAEAVRVCSACPLGTRGRGVPGMWSDGHPVASECRCIGIFSMQGCPVHDPRDMVMILGEAPGAVEQERGKPFVGGSGQLLHAMLKEVGLTSYYVSNIAKHQPYKDKQGKQQAPDKVTIEACAPFLRAEFDLVRPAKLILLGKTAAKLVCEGNFSMGKVVNTTYLTSWDFDLSEIPTLVLYHPAHFLYNRTAPWIQKQISEWKRSVRLFLGDKAPVYRVEKVGCETHGLP